MNRAIFVPFLVMLIFLAVGPVMGALEDDLVVYFTFDNVDGKTIYDSSSNELNANIVANAVIVTGKNGKGVRITAEGADCVNVPADEKLKISGEITMAAWIFQDSWSTDGQWFDKNCHNGGEHTSYGMGVFEQGKNINMFLGTGSTRPRLNKPHTLTEKTWHHVVGTYDGNAMKIYIDGEFALEHAEAINFTGTNDQDLQIGCSKDRPNYTFDNGIIDDAAIWSRALSEAEIKEVMNGGLLEVTPKYKAATTWGLIKQKTVEF